MKAYEIEVHFIGDPDYYYFTDRKEAERAAAELNDLQEEAAFFGQVKTTATLTEISLQPNQYIEGNEIITVYRRKTA